MLSFPNVRLSEVLTRLNTTERQVCALNAADQTGWGSFLAWNPQASFKAAAEAFESAALLRFAAKERRQGHYLIGYLSYDLGCAVHDVTLKPEGDLGLPDVQVLSFADYLTFDEAGAQASSLAMAQALQTILERPAPPTPKKLYRQPLQPTLPRQAYAKAFQQVRRHLVAGDFYEMNLCHRLSGTTAVTGRQFFHAVMSHSQANFQAYVEGDGFEIISASPERFVRVTDGIIDSFPIKGTRPRGHTSAEDQQLRHDLATNPKDQAELNMITDLMRNDLGAICEVGSVSVKDSRHITGYPTLWHAASRVSGRLLPHLEPLAALVSLMPGGSITGCPKKRVLELTDEIEAARRGLAMGTIFALRPDGTLDSNIAIRTLVKKADDVYLTVGGGIVYDSTEVAEYDESLDKARFFQTLQPAGQLSSDILEQQFGPTQLRVLAQTPQRRLSATETVTGQRLELSTVTFDQVGSKQFPGVHQATLAGRSLGQAFRTAGISFERREQAVSRQNLPTRLQTWFGSSGAATLVEVAIYVGPRAVHYADIVELYAPTVSWPRYFGEPSGEAIKLISQLKPPTE